MPHEANRTNGAAKRSERTGHTVARPRPAIHGPGDATGAGATLVLSSAGDVETLVRARGSLFMVTDRNGNIKPAGATELGLFHRDTRHLSYYEFVIDEGQLVRLSAETTRDGYNQIDLMLSGLEPGEFLDDPKNYLHVRRRQMLDGGLIEQITLTNFVRRRISCHLSVAFGCDFADVFEVRGAKRPKRGTLHPGIREGDAVLLEYDGLDGSAYATRIVTSPSPSELTADGASFALDMGPGESVTLELQIIPQKDGEDTAGRGLSYARRTMKLHREAEAFREASTRWSCDNGLLQQVLEQSAVDLYALRIPVGRHHIVGAGIPWFCAPFGRDALIAAYEALTLNRDIAADALQALAAFQGTKNDPISEEEPGKIFHELRFGEMAQAGEIPHRPYYGSVDATPLFVIVAEALYRISADRSALKSLEPAIVRALRWIDAESEEATRFVTYERKTPAGLENQGWKDSRAGVSFPDGRRAGTPIGLIEVQGYCVDAYARGSRILAALGDEALAKTYECRAEAMRALVERRMWLEREGRYAYAIDGKGELLDTVVSNVGHLLWSRLPTRERAADTARLLLGPASYSGFGVRTLAAGQDVYNPLSYHNGTVWPHDNALIARGLANYDLGGEVLKIFDGAYAAMGHFNDRRLPELFCGIPRKAGPLVRYPVACSPQAWAAAAPFLLLQSLLGISIDAPRRRLAIRNPRLPEYVRHVEFRNMRIGTAVVSMRFRRVGARCHVDRLDVAGGTLKTEIEID